MCSRHEGGQTDWRIADNLKQTIKLMESELRSRRYYARSCLKLASVSVSNSLSGRILFKNGSDRLLLAVFDISSSCHMYRLT